LVKEIFQGYDDDQQIGNAKNASRKVDLTIPEADEKKKTLFQGKISVTNNYMSAPNDEPRRIQSYNDIESIKKPLDSDLVEKDSGMFTVDIDDDDFEILTTEESHQKDANLISTQI